MQSDLLGNKIGNFPIKVPGKSAAAPSGKAKLTANLPAEQLC